MGARLVVTFMFLLAVLCAVTGRLYYLCTIRETILQKSNAHPVRPITIMARRGNICDRDGDVLAGTVKCYTLTADPTIVKDQAATAETLSQVLQIDRMAILKKLKKKTRGVTLARKLDEPVKNSINALGLSGIYFVQDSRRIFPNGSLAGQVLGFVGTDGVGLSGIEGKFNSSLAGNNGERFYFHDRHDRRTLELTERSRSAVDGKDVYLTIDDVIQSITENELRAMHEETKAEWAGAVVIDPATGEVLAASSVPDFDPNNFGEFDAGRWKLRAFTDSIEPGSTFKFLTAAAAFDSIGLTKEKVVDCEDGKYLYRKGYYVRDTHDLRKVPFREALAYSSNIATVKIAAEIGAETLCDYAEAFGFGRRTGVLYPGESSGILHRPGGKQWSGLSMKCVPIGHEVATTLLQLAAAYAAIANNGVYMPPRLVARVGSRSLSKDVPRRVISHESARILTECLEDVTIYGTATSAAIKGYRVAGKTGTSQKIDPKTGKYYKGNKGANHIAFFVGFVPADAPRLAIAVAVDAPKKSKLYHGGHIAGPVFSNIAKASLNYLNVQPSEKELDYSPERLIAGEEFSMPNLTGLTKAKAISILANRSLKWKLKGNGWAIEQKPEAGRTVKSGDKCTISFAPKQT
ncbi:penicillin-binding protein [Candidatus Hydrogenedentota bacterium]